MNEILGVEVSSLSSQNDIPKDSQSFSLGSMAYTYKAKPNFFSTMEDSIATVSTSDSITDHRSKFWNTACGISILDLPEENNKPDNGTPYIYVRKRLVSKNIVFAEVEAITGLKAEGLYSNYGRAVPGIGSSPMSPGPSGGNPPSPYGSGTNNPIYGGTGPNFNPNGPSINGGPNSNGPNIVGGSNNKKQNKQIKGFIRRKADQLGRALTSDEIKAFIKDAALNVLGNELSKRREKDLIDNLKNSGYVEDVRSGSVKVPFARIDYKKKEGKFRKNE
jgi:hypothetical protein